jgi:hypothetical protein
MTDDLDDLLGPTPPTPGHDRVKDAVLRATTRRLTWTRWIRRGQTTLAAAAVFAAGGAAGWFAKPTADVLPAPDPVVYPVPVPLFVSPDAPAAPSGEVYVAAERVELQAEQATDPAEVARLYRLAGTRFEERAEYGQARRCYRLHLLAAGPDGRAVSTDDSWLLISVKTSQKKETDRDPKQGS